MVRNNCSIQLTDHAPLADLVRSQEGAFPCLAPCMSTKDIRHMDRGGREGKGGKGRKRALSHLAPPEKILDPPLPYAPITSARTIRISFAVNGQISLLKWKIRHDKIVRPNQAARRDSKALYFTAVLLSPDTRSPAHLTPA